MFPIIFYLQSLIELYTSLSITIKLNFILLVLCVGPLIARTTWSSYASAMLTYGKTWTWIQTGEWWSSLSRSYRGERRVFDDNIGHVRVTLGHPNNRFCTQRKSNEFLIFLGFRGGFRGFTPICPHRVLNLFYDFIIIMFFIVLDGCRMFQKV